MNRPELHFAIGDNIIRKGAKYINSQILQIAYIDFTREVYIFKEPWIHSLTKFTNLHFDKTHEMFKKKE